MKNVEKYLFLLLAIASISPANAFMFNTLDLIQSMEEHLVPRISFNIEDEPTVDYIIVNIK